MQKIIYPLGLVIFILYGCASDYPCGEPGVGKCSSVSQNYQRSFKEYTNPEDLNQDGVFSSSDNQAPLKKFKFSSYPQIPADGVPLISSPRILRVWLTPYTDSDNIFHEQSYEYILTDKGHWLYSNNHLNENSNLKDVALIQGDKSQPPVNSSFGLSGTPSKAPNPNNLLNDFPAINALKNQPPPVSSKSIGSGIDRTTLP